MRFHAAISGAGKHLQAIQGSGRDRAGLSLQSVRWAGTRLSAGNRCILRTQLWRQLSAVRQDQCQWRPGRPAVTLPQDSRTGPARQQIDQMEFHQVLDPQGRSVYKRYAPATKPQDLLADIQKLLAE